MPRPSETALTGIAKRQKLLDRFDELCDQGMSHDVAARTIGYNPTTVGRWLKEREVYRQKDDDARKLTLAGGSFSAALERLRAGHLVHRRGASWFLQIVDGKICLYMVDGAGNRRFIRVATFGSADVLALDWDIYAVS